MLFAIIKGGWRFRTLLFGQCSEQWYQLSIRFGVTARYSNNPCKMSFVSANTWRKRVLHAKFNSAIGIIATLGNILDFMQCRMASLAKRFKLVVELAAEMVVGGVMQLDVLCGATAITNLGVSLIELLFTPLPLRRIDIFLP